MVGVWLIGVGLPRSWFVRRLEGLGDDTHLSC